MINNLRISFCITCKGRLDLLMQTLKKNLEVAKDYPNCEFIILDYDSQDGLAEWIKTCFQDNEIKSGRIVYAKYEPAPYFQVSHAKNMAHRLASGYILCNLDADNIMVKGFPEWLNMQFNLNPEIVVRPRAFEEAIKKRLGDFPSGIGGNISMRRENFNKLRGYNEKIIAGGEDRDLYHRANAHLGLKTVPIPFTKLGRALGHSHADRLKNLAPDTKALFAEKLQRPNRKTWYSWVISPLTEIPPSQPPEPANTDGHFGCGTVILNFDRTKQKILDPVKPVTTLTPPNPPARPVARVSR